MYCFGQNSSGNVLSTMYILYYTTKSTFPRIFFASFFSNLVIISDFVLLEFADYLETYHSAGKRAGVDLLAFKKGKGSFLESREPS